MCCLPYFLSFKVVVITLCYIPYTWTYWPQSKSSCLVSNPNSFLLEGVHYKYWPWEHMYTHQLTLCVTGQRKLHVDVLV